MNGKIIDRSYDSRFYTLNGDAVYEVPKKRSEGTRAPTITDAIQNGWVPSVTTVIKCLHKPNLQDWLIEQAVLAVVTTPRVPGETDDQFVDRVLNVEQIQEQQAKKAAQLGTDIHQAIQNCIADQVIDARLQLHVIPVMAILERLGKVVWSERVLVGQGYAGRADCLTDDSRILTLLDFKTTSKIPEKDAYAEHKMQVAAYAQTLGNVADRHIQTGIIYISTKSPGICSLFLQENWQRHYQDGFKPLLDVWKYMNNYRV